MAYLTLGLTRPQGINNCFFICPTASWTNEQVPSTRRGRTLECRAILALRKPVKTVMLEPDVSTLTLEMNCMCGVGTSSRQAPPVAVLPRRLIRSDTDCTDRTEQDDRNVVWTATGLAAHCCGAHVCQRILTIALRSPPPCFTLTRLLTHSFSLSTSRQQEWRASHLVYATLQLLHSCCTP